MKNLEVWEVSKKAILVEDENFVICYGHYEDTSSGELYVCSHNLVVTNYGEHGEKWSMNVFDSFSPNNTPINITYLSLSHCVCVGLKNGELFTIDDSGNTCETVGVCQNGLMALEWSPDQELLVLVTNDMKVIMMSSIFDTINESSLLKHEFGDKEFITVGWGKKETQFHGSEGKEAAKLKKEVNVGPYQVQQARSYCGEHIKPDGSFMIEVFEETDIDPDALKNNVVSITWRGDGNLFAVGFVADGIRMFKIFDKEGVLQYTSEIQQSLESNISWRPSGNLIATTQKLPNKYTVSFFEKNGLKHGDFTIPVGPTTTVEDLAWSSDSEILTLLCFDKETASHKILLFTSSNYHWYLKQSLEFREGQKVKRILWDNTFDISCNKKLHVILENGDLYSYTWIWNVSHSKGSGSNDDAVVAVIDGKKILATNFRHTIVPPPMSSTEIEIDSFVNSVQFVSSKIEKNLNPNSFLAITSKELIFFREVQKNPVKFENYRTIPLIKNDLPFQYFNWHWVNSKTIVSIMIDKNNDYKLIVFDLSHDILMLSESDLPTAVLRICTHPSNDEILYMQLQTGELIEYNINKKSMNPHDISFPTSCLNFEVFSVDSVLYFLSLTHKGVLYINGMMILNNVSSYFIHSNFLMLTTLKHLLLCVDLSAAGIKALSDYEKSEHVEIYQRKIERGAKLIIAVPEDTRTIFQLPRGNLETIQPRPLSLKIIGKYLDSLQYHEAFDLMRKQRINLNLIYDHNPDLFMNNIDIFISSIGNNSWLSLFLSDLENVDITKTMYLSSYADRKSIINNCKIKVKQVCDAFEAKLIKDKNNKALPLLTSFVKRKTITDLEKALEFIKQIKLQELEGSKLHVTSDEALKYLLYMVDVDKLFDVALGMYDFELVLLVANKSQKDPKEYIPMLNELNEMEENYKQFSINKYLKRFDKAVQCLVKCGTERYGELRSFVKYHSLYREALALFLAGEDIYKQISEDFGSYLKLKKQYVEAGIVYEKANNYDKAIECYKDAHEWELALKLAFNKPKKELIEVCRSLVEGLKENKRHKDALRILEMFCFDPEEIINYAVDSGQYKKALCLCVRHDKKKLKEQLVIPSLMKEYHQMQDLIHTHQSNFQKYRGRLFVVREIKKKITVDYYEQSHACKDSDLYSDSGSTVASSGSSRSFRSSKNRRKHERKVASLKEGSQYEDAALVMALHTLITTSYELRLPVKEINIALSCIDKDKEALLLQVNLECLLNEMKGSFKDIWTSNLVIEAMNAKIAAERISSEGQSVIPQGLASLDAHILIAPVLQEIQWKLEGLH